MLLQHIALVSDDNGPSPSELARVAAALQQQVMRDLAHLWGVTATVHAFPLLEDVPLGYWPIVVTGRELGGQAGVHLDDNGQPYAHIHASASWSLQASRVCLEMLVNPSEDRLVVGPSPRGSGALAEYLVEVCGPCDPQRGYAVNGVIVSDFCTPAFYGLRLASRGGYSINGSAHAPFALATYGHLTWRDPSSGSWWLRSHWTDNPIDTKLGAIDKRIVSVREFVQTCSAGFAIPPGVVWEAGAVQHQQASRLRAGRLRAQPEARVEPALEGALSFLQRRHNEAEYSAPRPASPRAVNPRADFASEPPPLRTASREREFRASEADFATEYSGTVVMLHDAVESPVTSSAEPETPRPQARSTILPQQQGVDEVGAEHWNRVAFSRAARRVQKASAALRIARSKAPSAAQFNSVPPVVRTVRPSATHSSAARSGATLLGGAFMGGLVVVSIVGVQGVTGAFRSAGSNGIANAPVSAAAQPTAAAAPLATPAAAPSTKPTKKASRLAKSHAQKPPHDQTTPLPAPTEIASRDSEIDAMIDTRR
jgi:hypothetical protein